MLAALVNEIEGRKDELNNSSLQSIYFGGGTPSLLHEDELSLLIHKVKEFHSVDSGAEITLEANPDDISIASLSVWKKLGINRLSIGLQSFRDEDLIWMNRAHNKEEALKAVDLARQVGFERLSVDLIYGLPNLSNDEWRSHLERVIAMEVDHVSAYCLTIEKKTALSKWVRDGKIVPASEDRQSEQFLLMVDVLSKNGYEQYEISNFAKDQRYAVHNTAYWQGKPYLGIGPSAHSFDGSKRRWNVTNNIEYVKGVGLNNTWFEEEILTPRDRWNELILTGLRTKFGVSIDDLKSIAPIQSDFMTKLDEFIAAGLASLNGKTITLTREGRLQADHIASELFV